MTKRRLNSKVRVLIILFSILLVCFAALIVYKKFFKGKNQEPVVPQIEVVDSIENFDYELNDNETEYYNKLFNELKDLLSTEDYDMFDYAVLVGKLFLADFYDLDSKVMKSDVGGIQFVYSDFRSDFISGAMDTVYRNVDSNVYGDRKQSLPVVDNVEKTSIERKLFEYNGDIDYDAYHVNLKISYKEDLGYPTDVLLVLIHNNDKLEIAKMETIN